MDTSLLNTLNIVALGVSAVCIVAIVRAGWLLLRLPADASIEKQKSIRRYLVVGVVIALISSATGLMNTRINAQEISELESRHGLEGDSGIKR